MRGTAAPFYRLEGLSEQKILEIVKFLAERGIKSGVFRYISMAKCRYYRDSWN